MAQVLAITPARINTRTRVTRNHSCASAEDIQLLTEPPLKKRRYAPSDLATGGSNSAHQTTATEPDENVISISRSQDGLASAPPPRLPRNVISDGVPTSVRPRRESRRERMPARPRFSSAAAAAAAVAHGDGFKPREERGWEEFHQDLDIDHSFMVYSSHDIDGVVNTPTKIGEPSDQSQYPRNDEVSGEEVRVNGDGAHTPTPASDYHQSGDPTLTPRRRPGRPPRRPDAMLKGIGISPDAPRIIPPPGFNPREKLTLPKPAFRHLEPFARFQDREEFVDQTMSNVGYQESELWSRSESLIRVTEGNIEDDLLLKTKQNDKDDGTGIGAQGVGRVEYDMDEQDAYWLSTYNEVRRQEDCPEVKPWVFEVAMTKIEKEWHALEKRIPKPNPKPPQTHRPRSSSAAAVNGEPPNHGEEQDTKCAICDDGDCENTNAIVFCDGCDLAVHQECYGVPFIPEGQWLCRKCQLIGRGTPTCIFCPNIDGAFKQTNASRWSHLLCAIWIPEVTIGNTTFMEPVMDVEKVPKPRWKLTCYICRQKMGACVQCGNKNCYIAFHVTCARRARLFLKMKSTHGGPTNLDASVLKAFCDKHVPADWRREHDVDRAIVEAMDYYRYTMRGRLWADSQQAALTAAPPPVQEPFINATEENQNPKLILKFGNKGSNRPAPPKIVWKLPSGAPVIPRVLYQSIENSLGRFSIKKRKDFASDLCKYWTLKREARRGAALLKRLQLQMETFNSMEIPRRNFVGMGAAGGVRLQRRLDFADILLQDIEKLRTLCADMVTRERQKLQEAKMLEEVVNLTYFPLEALLRPVVEKVLLLDSMELLDGKLTLLEKKIETRYYDSVLSFTDDLAALIAISLNKAASVNGIDLAIDSNSSSPEKARPPMEKAKKTCAKRIVRAAQGLLEDAIWKESQLSVGVNAEDEIKRMNTMLDKALLAHHSSLSNGAASDVIENEMPVTANSDAQTQEDRQENDAGGTIKALTRSLVTSLGASGWQRKSNGITGDNDLVKGHPGRISLRGGDASQTSEGDDGIRADLPRRNSTSLRRIPPYMEIFGPQGLMFEIADPSIESSETGVENGVKNGKPASRLRKDASREQINGHQAGTENENAAVANKKRTAANKKRKK